jgi:hypothetical protein
LVLERKDTSSGSPALDKNDDMRKKAKVAATRQDTTSKQRGKHDFMEPASSRKPPPMASQFTPPEA